MTRLSVAVRPSADVVATLAELSRPPLPGVVWALPEQWIVKIRPLGHVDERLVPGLADALQDALEALRPLVAFSAPRRCGCPGNGSRFRSRGSSSSVALCSKRPSRSCP